MNNWLCQSLLILLALCLYASSCLSAEWKGITFHGFASQRYINSSDNNYLGQSKGGTFDGKEAGLNLYYRFNNGWSASAQFRYQNLGTHLENDFAVDQLFLGKNLFADLNSEVELLVGRLNLPGGLYGEIQDIPQANASVFLPFGTYPEYSRPQFLNAHGAHLKFNRRSNYGDWELSATVGKSREIENWTKTETERLTGMTETFVEYDPLKLLRLQYYSPNGRWHLQASRAWWNFSVTGNIDPTQIDFSQRTITDTLAAEWLNKDWTVTFEYLTAKISFDMLTTFSGIPVGAISFRAPTESYQITTIYALTNRTELVFRYEYDYVNRLDKDGKKGEFLTAYLIPGTPAHIAFSKSLTFGIRHQLTDEIQLKTTLVNVDGGYFASSIDNSNFPNIDRYWNIFAAQVIYRF